MDDDKFKNYRIASARLQHWNYGWDAAYFITICTKDRLHYFGKIIDGEMQLSPTGILADVFWHEIKNHAQNLELDAFVVMPNHIHGIIILSGNHDIDADVISETKNGVIAKHKSENVEPGHALASSEDNETSESKQLPPPIGKNRFQNIGKNTISSILGSYKSAVTKHANRLGFENGWQTRFHEHIIRNQKSFDFIQNYIVTNPQTWEDDKFYGD